MSTTSLTAGGLSPKPLRFVPYDPGKKKSRRSRKNTGEATSGPLGPTVSSTSTLPQAAPSPIAAIQNRTDDAAIAASVQRDDECDGGLNITPGPESIGE